MNARLAVRDLLDRVSRRAVVRRVIVTRTIVPPMKVPVPEVSMARNRCFLLALLAWLAAAGLPACDPGTNGGGDDRGLGDGGLGPDPEPEPEPIGEDPDFGVDGGPQASRLNSIIPNRGDVAGGTPVLIVGRDFVEGAGVRIGDRPCREVVVENENHIRCTTPEGEQVGRVTVTVVWPDATRPAALPDAFTYFRPVALESVEPARAPARGGVEVHLAGRGFIEPTEVRFGNVPALSVEIENLNRIVAIAPPGTPGTVDVLVRNVNGQARLEDAFTWYEDLFLDEVRPNYGSVAGGDEVVLAGSGLADDSEVTFGGRTAEVLGSELERQRLRVRTPPHGPGRVSLDVANLNGEMRLADAFLFLPDEDGDFDLLGVVPPRVPATGGARFRVGGNGFTEETRVSLDGELVFCEYERPQLLTCVAPVHPPGAVDVEVEEGGERKVLRGGLRFYEEIDVYTVRPARGAVAGGSVVELIGRGFAPGMQLRFEDGPLEVLEVVDGERAFARTPRGRPGLTSLFAETRDDRSLLPAAYEYFDPVTRYGGVWGDAIERAVNVTVLNAYTGAPVPEADVIVLAMEGPGRWSGRANEAGQVTVSAIDLASPVSVTAAHPDYEVYTFERVTHANVTIYITPHRFEGGNGPPPEPVPPSRLTGTVTGINVLEKPRGDGLVLAAFVETTHTSMSNRASLPWPEPNGILLEDGPFDITCRPGEMAVIATAGYLRRDTLDAYYRGQIGYWQMRADVTPIQMGFRRFVSVAPGNTIANLAIHLDHRMNLDVPVTLDNPSSGVLGAPEIFEAWPHLDFGAEGWWALDTRAEDVSAQLRVPHMPDVGTWDPDIQVEWVGLARSASQDWTPYTITFERGRDLRAGVVIGPFVGAAQPLTPSEGTSLGDDRFIDWVVFPGLEGPTEPPDANIISISSSRGLPLWTYVTPGLVTEYTLPVLPEDVLPGGLVDEAMRLTITPVITNGRFDYHDFTYRDLGYNRRKSYSVTTFSFFR